MLTSEEKRELQHLEKIDAGYTEKFRNKEEWTEEEKKEQQKVYARIHELNKKIKSETLPRRQTWINLQQLTIALLQFCDE